MQTQFACAAASLGDLASGCGCKYLMLCGFTTFAGDRQRIDDLSSVKLPHFGPDVEVVETAS